MSLFDDNASDGLSWGGSLLGIASFGLGPYLAWTIGFQHGRDVGSRWCAAPAAVAASAAPRPTFVFPDAAIEAARAASDGARMVP